MRRISQQAATSYKRRYPDAVFWIDGRSQKASEYEASDELLEIKITDILRGRKQEIKEKIRHALDLVCAAMRIQRHWRRRRLAILLIQRNWPSRRGRRVQE